jgi:S1-C subfamily serine protease
MRFSPSFRLTVLNLALAVVAGALAGAIAGWTASSWSTDLSTWIQTTTGTRRQIGAASATSTPAPQQQITVIPVEQKSQGPLLPPSFIGRSSSVATVYRRASAKKTVDDGLLTDDRMLGQAVAVTSDGWFAFPLSAFDGLHASDIVLWLNGNPATATRAVVDHLSGAVFLKTGLGNVNAPAFGRSRDLNVGLSVWLERRSQRFEPLIVAALGDVTRSLDGVSSEVAARRPLLDAFASAGDRGAPVWGTNGTLLGVVDSLPNEPLHVIPASSWTQSLASVLSEGVARHAYLGVRGVDLAFVRFDQAASPLPELGTWLRDDKRLKKTAVDKASPAAIAGLLAGDVIQTIDRDILDGSADLGEVLSEYKPGSNVTVGILRGTTRKDISVTLGSVVTSEEIR